MQDKKKPARHSLSAGYAAEAMDKERELEALEWCEALVEDSFCEDESCDMNYAKLKNRKAPRG